MRGSIGGYKILRLIGSGGMGSVYLAQAPDDRHVAIKIANESIQNPQILRRFKREGSLRIEHPNLVQVLGAGSDGSSHYIVFEYVDGPTLKEIFADGPMAADEAVVLGRQVCSGLAAIHGAGVVHRDLKPTNILRARDGTYKILDFGLSLIASDETRMTSHGQILGTPAYLPPEQARGEIELDHRVDIWALGAILYEAISGSPPFERESVLATMLAIVMDQARPLIEVVPDVPEVLHRAVMLALVKNREERWSDAHSFAEALAGQHSAKAPTRGRRTLEIKSNERRLVVVLLAEEVTNPIGLCHEIEKRGGVYVQLGAERAAGIFGGHSSKGDEVVRAARASLASQPLARRLAVASGHTLGAESVVSGQTLASAEHACQRDFSGIAVDDATARSLAGEFDLQPAAGMHILVGESNEEKVALGLQIGRELELAQALREIDTALDEQHLRSALVVGPRGIGKSTLLRRIDSEARARHPRLQIGRVRCEPLNNEVALTLVANIVRSLLVATLHDVVGSKDFELSTESIEEAVQVTGAAGDPNCAVGLAELLHLASADESRYQSGADAQLRRDQIDRAVASYLTAVLSASPSLLLLEDVQWADSASLDLLHEIFQRLDRQAVAVVASVLPESQASSDALLEGRLVQHIRVGPLSRQEVRRMAEAIASRPLSVELTAELASRTAGNPLFVEHIVRALPDRGDVRLEGLPISPTAEAAIQAHLDGLEGNAKEICKIAAVLARPFQVDEIAAHQIGELDEGLKLLVERGVLTTIPASAPGERAYAFRSSLVADVANGMLLAEQRERAHLQAAQYLAMRRPSAEEEIARHYSLGGRDRESAHWYERAALTASSWGDADTVLRCSRHAVELSASAPSFELSMARSDALRFLGRREEQAAELEAALQSATSESQRAHALTELAWNFARTGNSARAVSVADLAVTAARDSGEQVREVLALGWRAVSLAQTGRAEEAMADLDMAIAMASGLERSIDALIADWRAQVAAARGDLAGRLAAFRDAQALYQEIGDLRRAAGAASNLADVYNRLGDYARAEIELRAARDGGFAVRNTLVVGYSTANLGFALSMQGRDEEAVEELLKAQQIAEESGETILSLISRIYWCRAITGRKDPQEIAEVACRVANESAELGVPTLEAMALCAATRAKLDTGEHEMALRLSRQAMSIHRRLGGLEEEESELFVVHARALEHCGHLDEASSVLSSGRSRVLEIAEAITDPALRATFEAAPANAALLAARS